MEGSTRINDSSEKTEIATRVLVVDDERTIADTLTMILRAAGFEAEAAYSGEDAIVAARAFLPDIVIADNHMPPGISGIEAAIEIKKILPGCSIIMLSGQSLTEKFSPFKAKGYNFLLLSKPIHPQDLLASIQGESTAGADFDAHARILNVDDSEEHRYSLSRLLARAGFDVSEAQNGTEAIRQAMEIKPDLVLLDIRLPDASGYDVCKALKENPETAGISVVHITAAERDPGAASRSAQVGADEYLAYPVEPKRLIHRIRELIQLRYLLPD